MTNTNSKKISDASDAKLKKALEPVNKRLDKVDKRLDKVEERLGKVEKRLDKVEKRLDEIEEKLDAHTASLMRIENSIAIFADMYKINRDDIQNLQTRVSVIEEQLDLTTPS